MNRGNDSVKQWIINHQFCFFPLLAFIIPFTVRIIPEVLMGQYTVGFDTMAYYVPNAILIQHNGVNLPYLLSIAPLFYAVYTSLVIIFGSPVFLLKIISPLLLGSLALSMFFFAKKGLSWSPPKSTFVAVLGTVYFVALRASSDQLREELSLLFLFTFLTLLATTKGASWKRYALMSLAMFALVLSDQIGAVIMFGLVLFTLIHDLFYRKYLQTVSLAAACLPSVVYFLSFYLGYVSTAGFIGSGNTVSTLYSWTGFPSYESMLITEAGFFLFCFLPLLPFVILGLKKFGNFQMKSWLLFSLALMLIPIAASPYRWILILVYPFAFYATECVGVLKSIKWKRFHISLQKIAVLYLILSTAILSFGFIFMTTQQPFIYFNSGQLNAYINQIPSSMLQNTVPLSDCKSTANALQWFKNNINNDSVLLTHAAFYGWALLVLNPKRVVDYAFENPGDAAAVVTTEGHAQVYLIWWIAGDGWYGLPTVPPQFHEVYQSGEIAIYQYISN